MKILWLTNFLFPSIAEELHIPVTVNEGWTRGLKQSFSELDCELILCSVHNSIAKIHYSKIANEKYYVIPCKKTESYDLNVKNYFLEILHKECPDIIHIMGSEFPHSYAMWQAANQLGVDSKCVVSIQGLISKCEISYDLGIDIVAYKKRILWDRIIKDSILMNKRQFHCRGLYEEKLLSNISNVIGRTEWDYNCIKQMNPNVNYYKCNETLRDIFYNRKWDINKCKHHSIIVSQATYPVKGFHILLKALSILNKKYDDIVLYVPSTMVYENGMKRSGFLNSDYVNYIIDLINRYNLRKNIVFLGPLNEEEMCEAYMNAHVFVCSSTIENSSNSVGEAMILGMPIVSSYVGGLSSLLSHNVEGFFYSPVEYYSLASYISILFEDDSKAVELGENARRRALVTHSKEQNVKSVTECYKEIAKQ